MTSKSIIESKISSIKEYIKILDDNFKKRSQEEIEKDLFLKNSLERYLYFLTQETISLAEAIIAYKEFRRPDSYFASFEILNEEHIISVDLLEKMRKMVGFRNFITHDYKKINSNTVYDVLQNKLSDIEEFVLEIKKYLNL